MRRVTTIAGIREEVTDLRTAGRTIGFVPTLGALHQGHLANIRIAAEQADDVVVSIFVNPIQFDRPDDLAAYPRDLEGDAAILRSLGPAAPALVFAPDAAEMYPREPLTTVHVARLTDSLCGATRPGHFDGVATVVTKLLNIVQPDVAVFGRKDFQQLQVIRRLVADLDLPVRIASAPTVREADGVALSSRNQRLSAREREDARVLSRALAAAVRRHRQARSEGGVAPVEVLRDTVAATLAQAPDVHVDYVEVVDPDTLAPPDGSRRGDEAGTVGPQQQRLLVAVAAFVGPVRLIDNVVIGDRDDEDRLLVAVG